MAGFDFASLTEDLSASEPCGPDLDLAGDPAFLNFIARTEGLLPASFFTRDDDGNQIPFDRTTINLDAERKGLDKFLGETRDLRLLTLYARLLALGRDLAGFSDCIAGIAALSSAKWEDVNPKGEAGDYSFRAAVLQALDDMPTVILPLQHLPLANSRRNGVITYRSVMISRGEAKGRPEDSSIDEGTIQRAIGEEEFDTLQVTRGHWKQIGEAVDTIRAVSIEKGGYENAVVLDRLPELVGKVLSVLDPIILARDPSAVAEAPTSEGADTGGIGSGVQTPGIAQPLAAGAITDARGALRALVAVGDYFGRTEPSSPSALIVRQARDLVGKSFVDVLRVLVPELAEQAKIPVGIDGLFDLTFTHLATSHDAIAAQAAEELAGGIVLTEELDEDLPPEEPLDVRTRPQASALLDQIAAFYRRTEPASPISLLADRARGLADRDFANILKDVLPQLVNRNG